MLVSGDDGEGEYGGGGGGGGDDGKCDSGGGKAGGGGDICGICGKCGGGAAGEDRSEEGAVEGGSIDCGAPIEALMRAPPAMANTKPMQMLTQHKRDVLPRPGGSTSSSSGSRPTTSLASVSSSPFSFVSFRNDGSLSPCSTSPTWASLREAEALDGCFFVPASPQRADVSVLQLSSSRCP